MEKNVKIAYSLIKLAKSLVSALNDEERKKSEQVLEDALEQLEKAYPQLYLNLDYWDDISENVVYCYYYPCDSDDNVCFNIQYDIHEKQFPFTVVGVASWDTKSNDDIIPYKGFHSVQDMINAFPKFFSEIDKEWKKAYPEEDEDEDLE